jgi:hypothetical protein
MISARYFSFKQKESILKFSLSNNILNIGHLSIEDRNIKLNRIKFFIFYISTIYLKCDVVNER